MARSKLVSALVVAFLVAGLAAAALAQEVPICTDPARQHRPLISGDKIVWTDERNGNWDVYMYDLTTQTEVPICTDPATQSVTAISGNRIVWEDDRNGNPDIYMYDLSNPVPDGVPVCTAPNAQERPAICGDIIVWADLNNLPYPSPFVNWDIYMYDLSNPVPNGVPVCTDPSLQDYPAISGNIIVWGDSRNASSDGDAIYMYDLSDPTPNGVPCPGSYNKVWPAVSGDKIVAIEQREGVYVYDLANPAAGWVQIWTSPDESMEPPLISGDKIVWQVWHQQTEPYHEFSTVYLYDLSQPTPTAVPVLDQFEGHVSGISGDKIVYWDGRDGSYNIYMLMLPADVNTPAGTSVEVSPQDCPGGTAGGSPVTLTYSSISAGGETTLCTSSAGGGPPPPSGFKLGNPATYYEITTTATFSGNIEVCIDYSGTSFGDPSSIVLAHYEGGKWVVLTPTSHDVVNHVICAEVSSLSPFALFEGFPVDVRPNTLNLDSGGKWVTCYIEPPEGCSPAQIDVATVAITSLTLDGAPTPVNIPAAPKPPRIGDYDADGLPDLMVKFSRPALQAAIGVPAQVTVTVEGVCSGTPFAGTDTIRAIKFYIAEQSVSPVAAVSVNLEFTVPEDCYGVANGKVKGIYNGLEIWRVPIHREEALSAGTHQWTWQVQVPANAKVGSRVKAKAKLKLFDAPEGTRTYKGKVKYKIPVL